MSKGDSESFAPPSVASPVPGRLWYMAALLCLTNAVAFIDRQSLPLLIDQIKADLQVTDTQMSYLIGLAFVATYVLFGIPAGMLIDRFPRRAVMAAGVALWSASTIVCGSAANYAVMFLGRLGIGAGETVVGPGSISLVRDAFPEGQRNRATSGFPPCSGACGSSPGRKSA